MPQLEALHSSFRKNRKIIWLAALALLFTIVYYEILVRTVKNWISFKNSYGLLIMAISIYLIWDRRSKLIATDPSPSIIAGVAVSAAGLSIYLASKLSNTLMLQGIALIVTLFGLVWLILGWKHLNMMIVPIGYLSFMFSFFEELLGGFSLPLQRATAQLSGLFLKVMGMPVIVSGELIELPHITLEVAKVCNGVNHIIAIVALSIPVAIKMFSKSYQKYGLIVLSFFIGLLANGLRVALIGLWTVNHHEGSIHGPFEFLYVSFILVVGLFFIGTVTLISNKLGIAAATDHDSSCSDGSCYTNFLLGLKQAPIVYAVCMLAGIMVYQSIFTGHSMALNPPLSQFPKEILYWHGKDVENPDWPFKNISGDQQLRRIYSSKSGGMPVGLTIAYFSHQTQDHEVINQRLAWLHLRAENIDLLQGEDIVRINLGKPRGMEIHSYEGDQRLFYFFYSDYNGFRGA